MEIRKEILDLINDINYNPLTIDEIKKELGYEDIELVIDELVDESLIFYNKKKDKILNGRQANRFIGKLIVRNNDYGFITNDYQDDIYVSYYEMQDAMNGDICLYKIETDDDYYYDNPRDKAVIIKVLKRAKEYLVGEVRYFRKEFFLIPIDKNVNKSCLIINPDKLKNGDIIRGKIIKYGSYLEIEKTDYLGNNNTVGIDISELVANQNVRVEFSKEVLDYTDDITIPNEEINRRTTFDDVNIYTIDSLSARDLDDAVSIKLLDNGNYELGVYIADVSYFVKENSILDQEAYLRGTSIYLLDRVIPMLPVRLSNDLASLNPNEGKLVIALIMEVDNSGKVVDKKFYEGLIKTTKRLSYEECNDVLDGNIKSHPDYEEVVPDLELMVGLQKILEEKRINRGAINFDLDEVDIKLDAKGYPINIDVIECGISEKIIEEFMILANETVAETMEELDLPAIYRVHDKPDNIKFMMLKNNMDSLGYRIKTLHPREIQALIESLDDEDCYLKDSILRLMAKAVYSTDNIGHFGLASFAYTHFTSPIRRYPDLITHRLIRKYLFNNDVVLDSKQSLNFKNKLENIAKVSSENERIATDLEFKVIDMKKAEYMSNKVGYIYEGVISSIHKFGFFVNIGLTIEGLVHDKRLKGFVYNREQNDYYNPFKGTVLKVGSKVKVKLSAANKITREIDFDLVYNNTRGHKPWKR